MARGVQIMSDPVWRGELRKGDAPGTIVGRMSDKWGWCVAIHGERQADGSYALTGTLGEPPACLRVPAIDGEAK